MKMKNIIRPVMYLQMAAFLLTTALGGPKAEVKGIPFRGSIETVETGSAFEFPFYSSSAIGTGKATHLGHFTSAWEVQVNVVANTATGTVLYTATNGDTLSTTLEGTSFPTGTPDTNLILEVQTITGGTGRFAGATGSFTRTSFVNLVTGFTSGSFIGTISY